MTVTLSQVRQAPAGVEHMALLDEYLRQTNHRTTIGSADWQPSARLIIRDRGTAGMVETVESGSLIRRPIRMRTRIALAAPVVERQRRRAVLDAARQAETARRQGVRQALTALDALLAPVETERQATARRILERRQAASLMVKPPGSGRVLDPGYESGTAVNGSETRSGRRWQSTPRAQRFRIGTARRVWTERPDGRRVSRLVGGTPLDGACRVSRDGGATWEPFGGQPDGRRGKRRTAAAAAPKRLTIADLAPSNGGDPTA